MPVIFILYVADQARSARFHARSLAKAPRLDAAPGQARLSRSKRTTRLRPPFLAWYMAPSASLTILS